MSQYVIRRVLMALPLLLAIATLVFLLLRIIPGDPGHVMLGDTATEEQVWTIDEKLGLHRPFHEQYIDWLGKAVRGDLGKSLISGRPVWKDLMDRLPRSMELTLVAAAFALLFGIPAGIVAAVKRDGALDLLAGSIAILGLSLPNFVVGTLLVLVFGLKLGWFQSSGYMTFEDDPAAHLRLLVLPVITLGLNMGAIFLRMTRSAMLEVLGLDYIRTARAKGLAERSVMFRHALKNALNPVITVLGLQIGSLLGAAVIVEYIFNWPGLATFMITGVLSRDYPAVQGAVLIIGGSFVTINLIVDLLYAVIDPRIRY